MADLFKRLSLRTKRDPSRDGRHSRGSSPSSSTSTLGRRSMGKSPDSGKDTPRRSAEFHANIIGNRQSVDKVRSPDRTSRNPFKAAGQEILDKLHLSGADGKAYNRDGNELSKGQARKQKETAEKQEKRERQERQSIDLIRRQEERERRAEEEDTPDQRARYGSIPANSYAGEYKPAQHLTDLLQLSDSDFGQEITLRARIHNMRKMSASLVFLVLRQQTATIQGVLVQSDDISRNMVHWTEHLSLESIVLIKGVVAKPKAKEGEITGTFIKDKELQVTQVKLVSKLTDHLPFSINEAETTLAEAEAEGSTRHHVSDRARLESRILDLRTTTSQAIFRVQSGVCRFFRSYLDTEGFTEIHSPKLQGGATESGASVFKVQYFDRTAFLAQSPQLAKQMSIAADFGRVYEVGPVFRAENSNTHRHLTEFTGLDLEMAIDEHYWEARNLVDRTLKSIFKGIYETYKTEIQVIKRQFPHEDLVWLDETPILPFNEGIRLLNESGYRNDHGDPLPEDEDLGTRDEIALGRVMKEKYQTDYYILDKFPASARPFYTMPDPKDPKWSNSFDVFVRGQEIISGGQRIHDSALLRSRMKDLKVDPKSMEEYMQGFDWGAPPHAGAGIGLERLVMLMLQLGDIRHSSLYPRDPKSLPAQPAVQALHYPEASTLHPPWEGRDRVAAHIDLQPLEKLIANYGDASNTSWLEPKFVIWRDADTGAAIGYVPHNGFAVTIGDPLCSLSQYAKIIATYLDFIKSETDLKVLWLLCGTDTENCLSGKFDWRTFSVAAEQRVDLSPQGKAFNSSEVQRKVRHADKEGVKIVDYEMGTPVPEDIRQRCDQRIRDWLGTRKSHQHVHLTDVHPWQDIEHRQYHYATAEIDGKKGEIAALLVLAQLSPKHGWQVKYSLDFPGSPSGAIEALIVHGLKAVQSKGATTATFGGGASNEFKPGSNLKGAKMKMLSKAYTTISTELKLTQKSEFREKMGTFEDPIYVCYPPRGLGPKGVHAILTFFED